jgi:ABC-type transport system involved in cytochrome bd biosynthesis fused ATPase/permease subunit
VLLPDEATLSLDAENEATSSLDAENEATLSLDAENEATVMEVLAQLKERITIVFVTHRESAVRWFDEVIKI